MESKNNGNIYVILSILSLCFSIVSIFVMYYIFAGISLLTGIISINNATKYKKRPQINVFLVLFIECYL